MFTVFLSVTVSVFLKYSVANKKCDSVLLHFDQSVLAVMEMFFFCTISTVECNEL